MINLNDSLFIAEGSHRAIYRHPDDSGKCLKIVKKGSLEKRRKKNKKWYKRLRRLSSFDETHKDIQAYRQFGSDTDKLKHIPRFYGMVETSLGSAMLLDLITNEDGSPSKTLAYYLKSGENRPLLEQALFILGEDLIASSVIVRDFSAGDVMVRKNLDGSFMLFIVDGLGGSELIPISKIPFFARRKAARRVDRFFAKLMRQYPGIRLQRQRKFTDG
jgi:hypothetical protein